MDGVASDDFACQKRKKLVSAGRAADGIQMSAVKGACCQSVGGVRLIVDLAVRAKIKLAVLGLVELSEQRSRAARTVWRCPP